jgi:hypothetical protein
MTSKHRDTNNEEKKDDSLYSHGEVVTDDCDVEVALSSHSPEDKNDKDIGTPLAEDVAPSALATASAATTATEGPPAKTWCRKFIDFYKEYDFLILLVVVILLAYAYPPLGADYLQPQITATWVAVMYIFCKYSFIHVFGLLILRHCDSQPRTSIGRGIVLSTPAVWEIWVPP